MRLLLPSRALLRYLALSSAAILFVLNLGYLRSQTNTTTNSSSSSSSSSNGATYDIALAFGDDHTQSATDPDNSGWLAHLSRFYDRRMDILNRGFAQYTSNDARKIAPLILPKTNIVKTSWFFGQHPSIASWPVPKKWTDAREHTLPRKTQSSPLRLLLIGFGSNDAVPETSPQHVPLLLFAENLRYIVSLLRSPESEHYSPHTHILFVTPPAVGDRMHAEAMRKQGLPPIHNNRAAGMYAETMGAVARELDLPCVDLWTAMELMVKRATDRAPLVVAARGGMFGSDPEKAQEKLRDIYSSQLTAMSPFDGYEMYLSDGFALNANGNRLLYKLIASKIVTTWPELRPF
ncbi:isoamyl acetate-hydrolyzing esterase [Coemansia sp. RSA 1694]|nr:isoamyl acetate-hydrolyzing esterase [Coemansia sp. RSA 1694]